jgi:cytochrome c-type biogenesis protein CcmH
LLTKEGFHTIMRHKLLALCIVLLLAVPTLAQTNSADNTNVITDNEVNDVAEDMYCPVCENIPLDACGTAACDDWREEIRLFLSNGMSEEEIRMNFVERFGDQVLDTPTNPILRVLSLVTPWLLVALAAGWVLMTLGKWSRKETAEVDVSVPDSDRTPYHEKLEQDLAR